MREVIQKAMTNEFAFHETPYGLVEIIDIPPEMENNIIVFLSIGILIDYISYKFKTHLHIIIKI